MNGLKLRGMGHSVPEKIITNEDMSRIVDTNDEWIQTRTGIITRHHCREETHTQLCVAAAKEAISMAGIEPQEIGACVVATITPEYLTPSAACMLQMQLGLSEECLCFDLNGACSGFLFALHTMECLLKASPKRYGLVVGAETLSKITNFEDRSTCILFGDGAGAAVVECGPDFPSLHAYLGVQGNNTQLVVPGLASGKPQQVYMEGSAIFKFAVEAIPRCIEKVLKNANKTVDDVDYFVFHQANARIIDFVVRKYHIPKEKYRKNIDRYGNTSAASIPILLSELVHDGTVHTGSRVMCVGFGGGLTWGGALLEM